MSIIYKISDSAGTVHSISSAGTAIAIGTCATAANVAEKVVSVENTDFELKPGVIIAVKFTNGNTASGVTLNVNSTGAKDIFFQSADQTTTTTTNGNIYGVGGRYIFYIYDGTYWVYMGRNWDAYTYNLQNSFGIGYVSVDTEASSASKLGVCTNYSLCPGGIIVVKFIHGNTSNSTTLNVNDKGAKTINWNGLPYQILENETVTMIYTGTEYVVASSNVNSKTLTNYYQGQGRPTSTTPAAGAFGTGRVSYYLATSSVTPVTEKPGSSDGHILHLAWDNDGGYDVQLGIVNGTGDIYTRAQEAGVWHDWRKISSNQTFNSTVSHEDFTVTEATGTLTCNSLAIGDDAIIMCFPDDGAQVKLISSTNGTPSGTKATITYAVTEFSGSASFTVVSINGNVSQDASEIYALAQQTASDVEEIKNDYMPKSGGTFTGDVFASDTVRSSGKSDMTGMLYNMSVRNYEGTSEVPSRFIYGTRQ